MEDHQLTEKEKINENMLLAMLQSEEKIEPFIDSIFKFLYRRTDFFAIQKDPKQPYGFPNGVSKNILLKIFDKYDQLPKSRFDDQMAKPSEEKVDKNLISVKKPLKESQKQRVNEDQVKKISQESGDKDENMKKMQEFFQSQSESYNGAIRENYSWAQSIRDIDIKVKIKSNISKKNDVKVVIQKDHLLVKSKNANEDTWTTLIDDNLAWKIKPDESTWSIFAGDHIHINLEKIEERWWENLLANESKLNLRNMNPEKPMQDLEPEAQAKIQQLMYDQHRKRLGLPSSEEEKYQEMLKKAWNAEGSPFKGTEFDPSKISIKDGNINIDTN